MSERLRRVVEGLDIRPGQRALEIGCNGAYVVTILDPPSS